MARPSLLLVSHAYAASENRKKAAALCEFCEVHLVTGTGEKEVVLGRDATEFETASLSPVPYRLTKLRKKGKVQSATRFYFENLAPVFQERAYDAVVVEVEPWSPLRWQCWQLARRYQKKARFIEFTWENVLRSGWKKELLGMVYRLAAKTHDGVVCGNQAAARIFQSYGAKPEHILVAPQIGVDEACYHPLGKEEKDREKVRQFGDKKGLWIGYCGRLVWEKGVMELVRAVEAARNEPGGQPLQLVLLGAGDLQPQLEALAADRPWLRLLPPRTHAEVASFLQALDWFVLPSQPRHDNHVVWEEQFGHVLIEAMACGVPCLGSNSGAILEVLGDPAAIFPAFEVEPLTRLLVQAKRNPGMALQFVQTQSARLTNHYTHAAVAQRWAPFLFGLPGPGHGKSGPITA